MQRSVVAAQNVLAIAVAAGHAVVAIAQPVMRRVAVPGSIIMVIAHMRVPGVVVVAVIWMPAGYSTFPIGRIRREIAGAGIGRALIGVVILMHRRRGDFILLHRIRQPLIGPATTVTAG